MGRKYKNVHKCVHTETSTLYNVFFDVITAFSVLGSTAAISQSSFEQPETKF